VIPNGIPMYIVGKLINDFPIIFCQAFGDSIWFIGARDHLAVNINVFNKRNDLFGEKENKWNITYAFDSNEVKRNIDWFRKKANSTKDKWLNIVPDESKLHFSNSVVEAKLNSIIEKPPIPKIPQMENGVSVKIMNLKEMVNQVMSIKEGVLKLTVSKSGMKMSGKRYNFPVYNILISHNSINDEEKSTLCLKDMLLISCQLSSEVGSQSADLKFYPNGATQISSEGDNVSILCLITAVKG